MNHINPSTSPEESRKFPTKLLLVALVILAAAAAILVFDVPVGTVVTYGFLGLMLFSHFFMHGAHGGHDHGTMRSQQDSEHSHADQGVSQVNAHSHVDGSAEQGEPEAKTEKDKDSHQGHSGGC